MSPKQGSGDDLGQLALRRAEAALGAGDPEAAMKWLQTLGARPRPPVLEGRIRYALAKQHASAAEWPRCERELVDALRLDPQPLYQRRLELVRRRRSLLDEETWSRLRGKIDPAERLPPGHLAPEVSSVWTCGAYHSRGHARGMPWSRFLRITKEPPSDDGLANAALRLSAGFLCRFVLYETPLLKSVDVVVAIPPDRDRYARRGMSLPDQLADAIEGQLGVPWAMEALVKSSSIELRGLPWAERRRAVKGSMAAGELASLRGGSVLLVDDVTTSGATLCEAGRILREVGVNDVHAVTLCHSEG